MPGPTWRTVTALGTAQTPARGSTYYLPAIVATPIARDMGVPVSLVFAAFSMALVLPAFLGPVAGRAIDRLGGRPVLSLTSVVFACGLALLDLAQGPVSLFAAWAVLGLRMGSGFYEAAFATLVRLHGQDARRGIIGFTRAGLRAPSIISAAPPGRQPHASLAASARHAPTSS